jgi:fatty acid desaturase
MNQVMSLRPISAYAGEIKPLLPARAFQPARSRLSWLPVHTLCIALCWLAIGRSWLPAPVWPLLSLLIGVSFAGLVFLGHETLHGAIVRGRRLRHLVGWYCFMPFAVSPRLWVAWHNRVHHGNANHAGRDPDAYPTLQEYRSNRSARVALDWFGIGRKKLRGLVSLLLGFSVQSVHQLLRARRARYLGRRELWLAWVETAVGVAAFAAAFVWLGPLGFLFGCALPVLVANAIVMGHILTNHTLSPHTDVNDPLANSLSVSVPRLFEFYTLGFGYHVEHHLFPWMSTRHGPLVRDLLMARYPDRYQSLPLLRAFLRVHHTPRVYAAPHLLYDTQSGELVATLGPPHAPASAPASTAPASGSEVHVSASRHSAPRRLGTRPKTRVRRVRPEP